MIIDIRCCIPKCDVGIVAECHNSGTNDIQGKKVFEPECFCLVICPRLYGTSVESMHSDDTGRWLR